MGEIKRHRRTKENLEKDLFQAANRVIEKVGFSGLTVTRLMKEAKADAPVFYNRYKDMNEFIDKFVRTYDYWLNDSFVIDSKNGTVIENIEKIMIEFIDLFIDNIRMQKLIAWELNDDNFITRRTAQNRDNNSEPLIRHFENKLKNCNINFNAASAILIGGIYYLIIHRKMGTFNLIDFSTKEGIDLLKRTIVAIVREIFDDHAPVPSTEVEQNTINIATELLKNGVSLDIIQRSTGLSEERILSFVNKK